MKYLIKIGSLIIVLAIVLMACEKKVDPLPSYTNGSASVLTSNVTTVAAKPADSLTNVITFSWTNPLYANDSTTTKYILEFDSSGRNFAKEQTVSYIGKLNATFTAKDLNTILLALGFAYNTTYNVDIRITSSYGNNNAQLKSNVLTLKMTPYVVPPKVQPPASKALFITGDATAGGWQAGGGVGVPIPAQQFTRLDSVTYQGTFYLNGGKQYLLLPVNGDWSNKYSLQDNSIAGIAAGGNFGYNLPQNFIAPATTGLYQITVDFQAGKFTVVSKAQYGLLYVPGDYQGWTPATAPTLGSPKNDGSFEGYINIPSGGTYQFKLNPKPDWSSSYGDAGGGKISLTGGNLSVPSFGYYRLIANTNTNTWSATKTTWSVIGSFAASGWSTDIPLTYDASSNTWKGTITVAAGDQFKFRANNDWGTNLGETASSLGSLSYGGDNIGDASKNFALTAGTKKITLYLNNSGYYTYAIQ
jgi:hypothetical protein